MTARWTFTKGLHEVGRDVWAYIQPDGSWGWSNAGLIVDGDQSLLVDTLFDLKLTDEMLKTMRDAVPSARHIDTVVNTHANGDHTFGNALVAESRIITTHVVADRLEEDGGDRLVNIAASLPEGSYGKRLITEVFGPFDHAGITHPPVSETFTGEMTLMVGDKKVHLLDVGPAHTASDLLVHVPDDGVVYTGDILFVGGHPAIWSGPIGNWIGACDTILGWDSEIVVPGHGPVCGKAEVRHFRDYLKYFYDEGRARYEAGMGWREAAFDMAWGPFSDWGESERVIINMITLWGELSGTREVVGSPELWELMGRYHYEHKPTLACAAGCTNHKH